MRKASSLPIIFSTLAILVATVGIAPSVNAGPAPRDQRPARTAESWKSDPSVLAALDQRWFTTPAGFSSTKRPLTGPCRVPNGYVMPSTVSQPDVLFNHLDRTLRRRVLLKAVRLAVNSDLDPWAKIERVQQVIRAQVSHSGNDWATNQSSPYTRYNQRKMAAGSPADLGDYLRLRKVVCREFALLTQVALEGLGLESRVAKGSVYQGQKMIGGHAWNEVKIDGTWMMVDTTNPQFNKTPVDQLSTKGISGWVLQPRRFTVTPQ